jgi:hypothetical protein
MRLEQTDQSNGRRAAVFVAVVGLHVLVGLLILASGTIRIARLRAAAPLSLLWLSRESPPQVPADSAAPLPEHNSMRKTAAPDVEPPPGVTEPSNAITLPLDLSAEADAAARRQSDKEAHEKRWRNLAGPSDSQLEWSRNNAPLIRDYHRFGDAARAEGGELITWMNDKCYSTTHGLTTFGLQQSGVVCKDPPKPETDLFKDMRKGLEQSAKGNAP